MINCRKRIQICPKKSRRKFSAEFKAQVGLEALRGLDGIAAIAAKHEVHPMQVSQWKKEVLERLPEVFATKKPPGVSDAEAREAKLYQKIGQLEMEVDWLKKNLSSSLANKRAMVEPKHRGLLPTPIQSKRR